MLFQTCSCAYVTRLPLRNRTDSNPERQYVPRTSINTPSMSNIRILGLSSVLDFRFSGALDFRFFEVIDSVKCMAENYAFNTLRLFGQRLLGDDNDASSVSPHAPWTVKSF